MIKKLLHFSFGHVSIIQYYQTLSAWKKESLTGRRQKIFSVAAGKVSVERVLTLDAGSGLLFSLTTVTAGQKKSAGNRERKTHASLRRCGDARGVAERDGSFPGERSRPGVDVISRSRKLLIAF